MNFSHRGLIVPPKKVRISQSDFYDTFIGSFPSSTTREALYKSYEKYTSSFAKQVTGNFCQWIGGSFTTMKTNPRDVDIVTLLRNDVLINQYDKIKQMFRLSWKAEGLDVYFLGVREPEAPDYAIYRSDFAYWTHQFSTSRQDRMGKRYARGYAEIQFNSFSYE